MRSFCKRSSYHHVDVAQSRIEIMEHVRAHLLDAGRDQGRRCDHADFFCAERTQAVNIGARDARVQDVADDSHA